MKIYYQFNIRYFKCALANDDWTPSECTSFVLCSVQCSPPKLTTPTHFFCFAPIASSCICFKDYQQKTRSQRRTPLQMLSYESANKAVFEVHRKTNFWRDVMFQKLQNVIKRKTQCFKISQIVSLCNIVRLRLFSKRIWILAPKIDNKWRCIFCHFCPENSNGTNAIFFENETYFNDFQTLCRLQIEEKSSFWI